MGLNLTKEFERRPLSGQTDEPIFTRPVKLVLAGALCVGSLIAGHEWGMKTANDALPNCQEDEVLYPTHDYEGPGKNNTAEYGCVHIDEITSYQDWHG